MTALRTLSIARSTASCATIVLLALAGDARPQTAAPASAAPSETTRVTQAQKTFSQEELDQLVAPVALYPDSLLAQVLMASTYPLDIVSAERWTKANSQLKDKALQDALQKQSWDPAVKSLARFRRSSR